MISRRFGRTREPTLQLSPRQKQRAEAIREKVETGEYAFETTECPVCEDRAFEELAREDRYGLQHATVICRDCGLIQVSPRMTAESFQTFYSTEWGM